jgi:hypothetical protein
MVSPRWQSGLALTRARVEHAGGWQQKSTSHQALNPHAPRRAVSEFNPFSRWTVSALRRSVPAPAACSPKTGACKLRRHSFWRSRSLALHVLHRRVFIELLTTAQCA